MLLQVSNETIEEIPKYFFTLKNCEKINQLTLNLPNLKRLRAADLGEFINLETLEIIANNLLEIDENSLNKLQNLTNFRLEAKKLPSIPNRLFFGLNFLETLELVVSGADSSATELVSRNQYLISLKLVCSPDFDLTDLYIGHRLEVLQIVLDTDVILQCNIAELLLSEPNNVTNLKLNCFWLKKTDWIQSVRCFFSKVNRLTVIDTTMKPRYMAALFQNIKLKYVNLSYNHDFERVSFKNKVNYDSLTYLNLTHNKIKDIENTSFKYFRNLEILNLSCNKIDNIKSKNVFNGLKKLNVLHMEINAIGDLNVDCFEPLIDLEVLNLTRNHIKVNVIDICKRLKSLKRLSLAANDLQTLENPENPKDLTGYALEVLDVQFNKIKSIDETFLDSMVNLRYLYLNNNQIASLNRYCFLCLPCLEYLNLSHNLLESLDGVLFSTSKKLKTLKLNNNKINVLPDYLFFNLRQLQFLDLSSNQIIEIPPEIFQHNTCIRHLNLSYNSITVIAEDAFSYSDFECVNLTNNIDLKNSSELTMAMISCDNCLFIVNKQIINNNKILKVQLRNPKNYVIQKVVEISKV